MARTPTRNQMIHCDICGEDYAATYKRCPFCDGRPPEAEDNRPSRRTGRRMTTNTRGGGYSSGPTPAKIISTVVSLAFIVAAVCIVVSIVKPMIDRGSTPPLTSATPALRERAGLPFARGLPLAHSACRSDRHRLYAGSERFHSAKLRPGPHHSRCLLPRRQHRLSGMDQQQSRGGQRGRKRHGQGTGQVRRCEQCHHHGHSQGNPDLPDLHRPVQL